MCPPPYLIPRTIRLWYSDHTQVALSSRWPMLFPTAGRETPCVAEVRVLPKDELVHIPGRSGSNLFNGAPNMDMKIVPLEDKQLRPDEV